MKIEAERREHSEDPSELASSLPVLEFADQSRAHPGHAGEIDLSEMEIHSAFSYSRSEIFWSLDVG